jgi:hypothetical protein
VWVVDCNGSNVSVRREVFVLSAVARPRGDLQTVGVLARQRRRRPLLSGRGYPEREEDGRQDDCLKVDRRRNSIARENLQRPCTLEATGHNRSTTVMNARAACKVAGLVAALATSGFLNAQPDQTVHASVYSADVDGIIHRSRRNT